MSTPDISAIAAERRQLINLAYRMLGSLADAEDVVQDTYARWYALSREQQDEVESPGAWLTKVASRICLDLLGSARVRRERYVGEWIPEPIPDQAPADPADRVTLDESVSMAFLVVLESMTPAERVAFILHDVFRYPFTEIADIVGRTPAACRQLATAARRRLDAAQPSPAPATHLAGVVRNFQLAWAAQDIEALVGLLDPDVTVVADGGGRVNTVVHPVQGAEQVAQFALYLATQAPGLTLDERMVNGQPGLVGRRDGVTVAVFAFELAGDLIRRIWAVRNPAKLGPWTAED
ncbi:MAG: RNA polymerase sigma factor SigJ [Hamadaea sp.]|nr:RNA polymerase sigma factor SigJ [Hamadaea sp.]NUT03967.1 RNA polymerase sigma factor SigJ [Hamadaea sp.]